MSVKPGEGEEAFQRILSLDIGNQIVVSTRDLQARLDKWVKLESLREPKLTTQIEVSPLYFRPNLSSVYIAPGNTTEQTVAEIWQELLRVEKIGIHDSFVELGGHSLLATQVITRLRGIFPVQLSVESIVENATAHR